MKVINVVASLFIVLSTLQLNAQFIPSYLDDNYTTLGNPNLSIQRPTDSYQSIRIRSLSKSFTGLILDNYTDHFLNPAFQINSNANEAFADYATKNKGGKFLLGSSININDNSFCAFIDMEKLADNSRIITSSAYPPSTPFNSFDNAETLQRFWGGSLSYSKLYSEKSRLGIEYQFRESDDLGNYIYGGSSSSSSKSFGEQVTQGNFHKVKAGFLNPYTNSTLSAVLSAVFASYTWNRQLENYYRYQGSSTSTYSYTESPTDVVSNGAMASITYRTKLNENINRNLLFEIGYTGYNIDGKGSIIDTSNTNGTTIKSSTTISSSNNGKILDVHGGCSFDKNINGKGRAFFGLSLAYVHNSFDREESSILKSMNGGSITTNSSSASSGGVEESSVTLPVGVEFFVSDIVTLRGGIEPVYKTHDQDSLYSSISTSETRNVEFVQKGLSLSSNLGIGVHYDDFGELNVLFSNLLTNMSTWSFSCRYFL